MNNNTFGDLMSEYERKRDAAKRFDSWDTLDLFVKGLIQQVAPKVETSTKKFQEFSFDGNGAPVDDNG